MKKTLVLLALATLLAMCGSSKTGTKTAAAKSRPEVQYKDDFRAAPDKDRTALLKEMNASGAGYSVVIFTKNYKGEKISIANAKKTLYNDNPITNLKTGIADKARIDNTLDTRITDGLTKKEAVIEAKEAQKHKFIYIMKNPGADNPFVITYSNTLRPLE